VASVRGPDFVELGEGRGSEAVYGFYLPRYRDSEPEDFQRFPIKIGSTTGSVSDRLARLSTALPERMLLAVLIWTSDAPSMERAIQAVLTYQGRWHAEAGGSEWYNTHPLEVKYIYWWLEEDWDSLQKEWDNLPIFF
jgi:hypothetical protein